MKALLALASLLIATSSFALSSVDSWEDIKAEVKADHKLSMTYGAVFVGRPISAFDTCIEGDMFKTTRKFDITERQYVGRHNDTDGERDGYMFVVVGQEILTYPIVYTTTERVCDNHDKNCKYVTKVVEQDTVKPISVKKFVKRNSQGDRVYKTLFKKDYVIPACN